MKRILSLMVVAIAASSMAQQGGGGQGRPGGMGGMMGMGDLMVSSLLRRPDVAQELNITAEQRTALQAALGGGREGAGGGGLGGGAAAGSGGFGGGAATGGGQAGPGRGQGGQAGGQGRGGIDPAAIAAQEAKIKEILDAGQWARLWELYVQRNGNRVILRADFQTKLGFSDMQKAQVKTAQEENQASIRAAMQELMAGGQPDMATMRAKMTELNKAYDAKLGAIINADQKAALDGMKGEKFEFQEMPQGGRGGGN